MSFNRYITLTGYFLQSHSFHEVKQAECECLLVLKKTTLDFLSEFLHMLR